MAPDEAGDLVQDILLVLVQQLASFKYDQNKSFRGWLWTITLNKYRERRRREKLAPQIEPMPVEALSDSGCPEAIDEAEYRRYLVNRALQIMQSEFQPTTWKACWEHVVSGRSAAEVAQELGISEGAVYVAKHRVLRRLREDLDGLLD